MMILFAARQDEWSIFNNVILTHQYSSIIFVFLVFFYNNELWYVYIKKLIQLLRNEFISQNNISLIFIVNMKILLMNNL